MSPPRPGPTFEEKRRSGKEAVSDVKKKRAEYGLGGFRDVQPVLDPSLAVPKPAFDARIATALTSAGIPEERQAMLIRTRPREVPAKKKIRETELTRRISERTGGRRAFPFSRRDR